MLAFSMWCPSCRRFRHLKSHIATYRVAVRDAQSLRKCTSLSKRRSRPGGQRCHCPLVRRIVEIATIERKRDGKGQGERGKAKHVNGATHKSVQPYYVLGGFRLCSPRPRYGNVQAVSQSGTHDHLGSGSWDGNFELFSARG